MAELTKEDNLQETPSEGSLEKALESDSEKESQLETPKEDTSQTTREPKFKTLEEYDKAYQEAERRMHQATREAAELRNTLSYLVYKTQQGTEEQKPFSEQFFTDPERVLAMRERQLLNQVTNAIAVQDAITKWRLQNPDLLKYEDKISAFLVEVPTHLPPAERLVEATKAFRQFLGEIKNEGKKMATQTRQTLSKTYVETPSSRSSPTSSEEEESYEGYINRRRALRDKVSQRS